MFMAAAALALLLICGCAAPQPRPLSLDHPANPEATPSPPSPRPNALAATRASSGASQEALLQSGAANDAGDQPGHAESRPAAGAVYACPMHPEVTSSDSEARCPKCGMKLEVVKPGGAP